jgi:hypothetical protein
MLPVKRVLVVLGAFVSTGFFVKSVIDPGKDHYTVWEPSLYEGVRMYFMKQQDPSKMTT